MDILSDGDHKIWTTKVAYKYHQYTVHATLYLIH